MSAFADHSDILQHFKAHSSFIPISGSLLTESTSARFPIFVADWDTREFLLFCEEGKPFRPQHMKILTDNGKIPVFIPVEYGQQVNKELSNNLISVLENDSLPIEEKAERFHTLSTLILKSLFDSPPRIEIFIETASVVSDTMAILLSSGPEVIGTLQNLRSFDYYTYGHSLNVTALTVGFYHNQAGHLSDVNMKALTRGVLLHDIGKCDIPKSILNKEGVLTPEEWEIVRRHPETGYRKLSADLAMPEDARLVSLYHHESWDGNGYPRGLQGEEIPLTSRICKICDVYDALTSRRCYKERLSPFQSLQLMKDEMKGQFDPHLFKDFIHFFKAMLHHA